MKKIFAATFGFVLLALTISVDADVVTIENLDVRGTGIFGVGIDDTVAGTYASHVPNTFGTVTLNGGALTAARTPADPIDIAMTYSNLDLDGDASPNDAVTFTIRWTKIGTGGGPLVSFGQGIDTGFGNLNDLEVSVINVSGTTTDFGDIIAFDGFTGAGAGAGILGAVNRSVEINGTNVVITTPGTSGGFEFGIGLVDFALAPTVTYDNSGGVGGSIVARTYDLQFSTVPAVIPEPSSLAIIGVGMVGLLVRRRR